MNLFVGIDVSSKKLDVCFLDSDGLVFNEVSLGNDIFGASTIKDEVLKLHSEHQFNKIVIGMESTSVYSHHPSTYLHEDDELKALGIVSVVVQNPKAIHRYANIFDEDKTDTMDALHIADFLRMGRYKTSVLKEDNGSHEVGFN